jgi:hypothetical protein
MSKLLLMSIAIAFIVIPTTAARNPDPREGLRRVVVQTLAFELFYAFSLIFIWGRI